MFLTEDLVVRVPGEVAFRLAIVASEMTQRVAEIAVSSGLAIVTVGVGRLLFEPTGGNIEEEYQDSMAGHDIAA